jgi:hypothetical protein
MVQAKSTRSCLGFSKYIFGITEIPITNMESNATT